MRYTIHIPIVLNALKRYNLFVHYKCGKLQDVLIYKYFFFLQKFNYTNYNNNDFIYYYSYDLCNINHTVVIN